MSGKSTTVLGVLLIAVAVLWFWWSPTWSGERPPAEPDAKEQATETLEAPDREEGRPAETAPARSTIETPPAADEKPKRSRKELWGRVIRRSNKTPIANATVRLLHADADEFWNLDLEYSKEVRELARTTTATDGSFHFAVEHARKHRLEVVAAGYPRVMRTDCVGGVEVVVQLDAAASVRGTVTADRKPVGDAAVRIAVRGERIELAKGHTEIDGTFRFGDLPAATVYVQVDSPRFVVEWKLTQIEAGKENTVDVQLTAGRHIRGKVLAKASGKPVAGAEISNSWTFKRRVRSAADGSFEIRGVESTDYTELHVRAQGFANADRNVKVGFTGDIVFRLETGSTVFGRYVDRDGKAPGRIYSAAGASYMASPGMQNTDWIRAVVAPSGHFTIAGLRPDQHYWLYVRGRGYGNRVLALPRRLKNDERHDVGTIVLHPAGGIAGHVIDERGKPRVGIEVSLRGANSDSRVWLKKGIQAAPVSQFTGREIKTDREGGFFFNGVSAGTYGVSIHLSGHRQSPKKTVEVQDGVIQHGVELVLATGLVIEGVVRYPDGRVPEAGTMWLKAWRKGERLTSMVGPKGRFRFAGLEAGKYSVAVAHQRRVKDWTLRPVHLVDSGTRDLKLELEQTVTITGRVVDTDGKPLRAWVWFHRDKDNRGAAIHKTGEDGRFEVHVASDFVGTLFASPASGPTKHSTQAKLENVRAGQRDLELRLKRLR